MEQDKINRYAEIIATVRIHGHLPADITTKEFNEIALWDEVANRVEILVENNQPEETTKVVGTVNMSDLTDEGEE
jgi:hypothetical protein